MQNKKELQHRLNAINSTINYYQECIKNLEYKRNFLEKELREFENLK